MTTPGAYSPSPFTEIQHIPATPPEHVAAVRSRLLAARLAGDLTDSEFRDLGLMLGVFEEETA